MAVYVLSIPGTLAPSTLEAARKVHNETAGAPANVAAARSLGDLSHMVYAPVQPNGGSNFLILDLWNSMDGLNQFFTNPHVQEQAGQIFTERDPVIWTAAEGFISYHFPAPYAKSERIIGTVRGLVNSREEAREIHNALVGKMINKGRARGNMSHDAYFRLTPPGTPESLEFFAVDVWMDAAGMNQHYDDPEFMQEYIKLFAGRPDANVWTHPAGEWVEW
jgi:quinol monooxygenase YgiN